MFDVGFWEVSLIAIVALVVVGPERLPRLARTVGLYVGKARRVLRDVRSEIDREINRAELSEIKDIKDTVSEAKSQIDRATADVSKTLNENIMSESSESDSDLDGDLDGDGDEKTIHKKADEDKAAEPKPSQPAADPPMPAALKAASMSGGAANASKALSAASASPDATANGDGTTSKTRPAQTGDLPIPSEDKSDDDY